MLSAFARDIRFSWRQFTARPGFTFTAVLVLALGLGANTAIFSVVYAFLLRPLPFPQPDRLVTLQERIGNQGADRAMGPSPAGFLDWQKQAGSFASMSAFSSGSYTLSSENNSMEPERVRVCFSSDNLTRTLGVRPALGRGFTAEEDRPKAPKAAIVSDRVWRKRLGGNRNLAGLTIRLEGTSYQVVGVMPPGFLFPSEDVEVWAPLLANLPPQLLVRRDIHFLSAIGRVRTGVPIERARAELDGIVSRYKHEHSEVAMGVGAVVTPLHDVLVQDSHLALLIVLGAVGCVLLIACVNVANLLLTRSSARVREFSIRVAVGASRAEIVRQLLTESVLLAVAGGAAGVLLAKFLAPVLMAHTPGQQSIATTGAAMDPMVFAFAFAIALATGVFVGLYPALHASRTGPAAGLRDSARSAGTSRSHARFRGVLISLEVALSVVLLVSAGLMVRSFQRLLAVQPGFRTQDTLTMGFTLGGTYKQGAQRAAFYQQVTERLQNIPGVEAAGLTCNPPASGYCDTLFFYRDDRPYTPGKYLVARELEADPGYLAAAGVPLKRGRNLTVRDGAGFDREHPRLDAMLINETMARKFFPGEDPIGKRIFFDYMVQETKVQGGEVRKYEIVGVVGDVLGVLDREPEPIMYRPLLDGDYRSVTAVLHTRVAPLGVVAAATEQIHSLDRSLAVYNVKTVQETMGSAAADRRFAMLLFGSFALLSVLLAAVGLYGVLSYAVVQRRGEIGIRMALGASASSVSRFILWEGMKPALAGVAVGCAVAFFACRVLKALLFGIAPLDPVTFAVAPPLLLAIAALACYLPALRATRIDPTVALRSE